MKIVRHEDLGLSDDGNHYRTKFVFADGGIVITEMPKDMNLCDSLEETRLKYDCMKLEVYGVSRADFYEYIYRSRG